MRQDYYVWVAAIAFALAVFACAIMAVGYQPVTAGRAGTIAVLLAVGAVSLVLRRRRRG